MPYLGFMPSEECVLHSKILDEWLSDPDYSGALPFELSSFSPNGQFLFSRQFDNYVMIDRATDTAIYDFPYGMSLYAAAVDNDGRVYGLESGTTNIYDLGINGYGTPSLINGAASDLGYVNSMRLFIMPDDTRRLVWISQFDPQFGIVVYNIDTDTLTEHARPDTDMDPWRLVQDTYGDIWAIGPGLTNTDTYFFWRVVDFGAGSAAPDFNEVSGFEAPVGDQITMVHHADGWFLSDAGAVFYTLAEDDFSIVDQRNYSAGVEYTAFFEAAFLEVVPPGSEYIWYIGSDSVSDYLSFEKIQLSDLSTIDTRVIADWGLSDTFGAAPRPDILYFPGVHPAVISRDTTDDSVVIRYLECGDEGP